MNKKIFIFSIVLLITSSCCREDSKETARYKLSKNELNLIPYTTGQKINFIHSNGFTFNFNVTKDTLQWESYQEFCEFNCCGQDYFSFQTRNTKLESIYPKLSIELSLGGSKYRDYNPQILNIIINNTHFVSIQYDSLTNFLCDTNNNAMCYDSILINNKLFANVIESPFESNFILKDSTILYPKSLFYNRQGLIQIKMSNNETYSLNN